MRTTIVPAQITTVEDRIAGNLSMAQIFLLLTPVFFGVVIYITLPNHLHFAMYKLILILCITLFSCTLAIRIKGKILLQWIVILLRYNNRPRYYICTKNDTYQRDIFLDVLKKKPANKKVVNAKQEKETASHKISLKDAISLEDLFSNPQANISFKAKKGGMYVSLSQIKQ